MPPLYVITDDLHADRGAAVTLEVLAEHYGALETRDGFVLDVGGALVAERLDDLTLLERIQGIEAFLGALRGCEAVGGQEAIGAIAERLAGLAGDRRLSAAC